MYQNESDKDVFLSGYILETLSDVNRNRYLILFDNGEVRYVYHYFVRKVVVTASVSCSETHQKMFLDTYFQLYPKKKNIHRTNRKLFYVEHNCKLFLDSRACYRKLPLPHDIFITDA